MEQVITVETQKQYDRVLALLVKDGHDPFIQNGFKKYGEDTYIHTYGDKPKLFFGVTNNDFFDDYLEDGLVISYEDFIKYHPMTQEIASKLVRATNDEQNDNVNHPNHYNSYSREVIDTLQGSMTPDEFKGYLKGNIMKYVTRYQFKNGVEDLKKAQWYLNKLEEVVENEKQTYERQELGYYF